MTETPVDLVLRRLNKVKKQQSGFIACCPAHEDHRQSLSVSEADDGRVLIHCHAGCEIADILGNLGLEAKDLFMDTGRTTNDDIITYDYTDADGKLVYQVVRKIGKRFVQRRPDGAGGWIYNLRGVDRVPYRLPEVLKAIERGETIFINEGEKDVEKLRTLGLVATTNSGGAGKWTSDLSPHFKGASVVLVPDNDKPGHRHVQDVAAKLKDVAESVKIVQVPGLEDKQDISDWIAAGGTKDRLLELADAVTAITAVTAVTDSVEDAAVRITTVEGVTSDTVIDEDDPATSSFHGTDTHLYEQVMTSAGARFISYEVATGKTEVLSEIRTNDTVIRPLQGDELDKGAVILPAGVREYGETTDLLAEIEDHIGRYLDVSPAFHKFASYYVLLTWLYDRLNTLPYLRALGDTGCGKSRFLDTVGGLCYKVTIVSGCITPAPIYRLISRWGGTLIIDEADFRGSDEYNEVVTILNCGFERGRPVIRATRDNPDALRILPVFGPKVFSTRQRFQDAALEARCLTEIMEETGREDIPVLLDTAFNEAQVALREKLLLYRLRNWHKTSAELVSGLDLGRGIEPRLKQISGAFLALFSGQDNVMAEFRRFIQSHQRELVEQRLATPSGQIVEALFTSIESVTAVTGVTGVTGKELYTITPSEIAKHVKGVKDVTPQVVGQALKSLGLKTKPMRCPDGKTRRYLVKDDKKLETLRRRYIPADEVAEETEVSVSEVASQVVSATSTADLEESTSVSVSADEESKSKREDFAKIEAETGQNIQNCWQGRDRPTPGDDLLEHIAEVGQRIDKAKSNGLVTVAEFKEVCDLYEYLNTVALSS